MKITYEFDPNEDDLSLKLYQNVEKYYGALHEIQYTILRNFDKYEEVAEDPHKRVEQFERLINKIKEAVYDCDLD